ncbi:MAG: hypothetical protein ACJA01_003939 [Saprospiraceae bacterium]|jgi:hypothetical protein
MLDPRNNRLDYGVQLKAPEGYQLDHAIATTYSLDLEAILLVPVALFFSEGLDFNPHEVRDDMLEALTNASKHISIYCQRGKIKAPNNYNQLMAFWEKGIHQIQMPEYSQSFHPKIWVIRYAPLDKKEAVVYRLICTSRNLTFSRDWDMAITTEGKVSKHEDGHNKELMDMLRYLDKEGGKKIPKEFLKEISTVVFDVPHNFNSLHFHPIGIAKGGAKAIYKHPVVSNKEEVDHRLVMSPFLDKTTIERLKSTSKRMSLFSSEYALSGIEAEIINKVSSTYMFSTFIEDAENTDAMSEVGVEPVGQQLHAKFYIDKKGQDVSWFIGSANATQAANDRNIEFLVELKTKNYSLSPKKIEDQLTFSDDKSISLFDPYSGSQRQELDEEKQREQEIRKLIHGLSGINIQGEAIPNPEHLYDLIIQIPRTEIKLPEGCTLKFKPLPDSGRKTIDIDISKDFRCNDFRGYQEHILSPFLLFEIYFKQKIEKKFILDMNIHLSDDRFRKIFSSIINNRSKFLSYLAFLLSEETPSPHDANELEPDSKGKGVSSSINALFEGSPVFEKLLITASREPKKLTSIDSLILRLKNETDESGNSIVSAEFQKMWEVFHLFHNSKK